MKRKLIFTVASSDRYFNTILLLKRWKKEINLISKKELSTMPLDLFTLECDPKEKRQKFERSSDRAA